MGTLRVLVANEPRAYRETLAAAFQRLRPQIEIRTIETPELDAAVLELVPRVVVCSQLTPTVERAVPAWVLLYPEGQRTAVLSIANVPTTVDEIGLAALLSLIDEAHRLVQID